MGTKRDWRGTQAAPIPIPIAIAMVQAISFTWFQLKDTFLLCDGLFLITFAMLFVFLLFSLGTGSRMPGDVEPESESESESELKLENCVWGCLLVLTVVQSFPEGRVRM